MNTHQPSTDASSLVILSPASVAILRVFLRDRQDIVSMIWNGNSNKKTPEILSLPWRPMGFRFLVADLLCRLRTVSSRGKMTRCNRMGARSVFGDSQTG